MGLSPLRWWCELKGGRAERRRQVENQGKTRHERDSERRRTEGKRRRCFSSTSFSSIANKIVRNYCDYGKLIYSHIERGIAFTIRKWKIVWCRKRAVCCDMILCLRLNSTLYHLWFYMVNTHMQSFAMSTRCVHGKRRRQILP